MSVEYTSESCLTRSIDGACVASPPCTACRFCVSLWAKGEYIDHAEALWPTPPDPPFARGGKRAREQGAGKHLRPVAHNEIATPWRLIGSMRYVAIRLGWADRKLRRIGGDQPKHPYDEKKDRQRSDTRTGQDEKAHNMVCRAGS